MVMCGALAIHVADEALTGYLDWHNQTVLAVRQQYPLVLLPTFTFEIFLSLLIFAVVSLSAVSYFVWTGRWAMRPISHVFAIHAGKRISPHRPFNLHARVYAGRVYLTATDSSINTSDYLHEGLPARGRA